MSGSGGVRMNRTIFPGRRNRQPRTPDVTAPGAAAGLIALAALSLMPPTGPLAAQAVGATSGSGSVVSGAVYDSIARRRIPGVTVQLVNADAPGASRPLVAVADSAGRYSIAGVPAGRYLAGFFHAALDTLGLELPPRLVEIRSAAERVDLATPSPRTVLQSVCPTVNPDSTGLFMGVVASTSDESQIAGASVVVEWSEFVLDGVRVYERPRQTSARTSETGWFAFCGLPADGTFHAKAASGADSSGYVEIEVPARGLRHQRFLVGGASRVEIPAPVDSASPPNAAPARPMSVLRGDARLSGTVSDPNGRPVANAHVLVWGTNVDVQTNERGSFAIEGLPGGTHTLEVRVIGYVPVTRVVQLAGSRPATIEIQLDRAAVILATETVRGKLVYSRNLIEFDRRRRTGFGRYITTEEIDRRPNARLGQLLQGVLGVRVDQSRGENTVLMRGSTSSYCTPSLYVDGRRDLSNDFNYLYSDEIAAIEVYARDSQRPAGYTDSNPCGAILVWTRARSPRR